MNPFKILYEDLHCLKSVRGYISEIHRIRSGASV
jgi:hypothetical protein